MEVLMMEGIPADALWVEVIQPKLRIGEVLKKYRSGMDYPRFQEEDLLCDSCKIDLRIMNFKLNYLFISTFNRLIIESYFSFSEFPSSNVQSAHS